MKLKVTAYVAAKKPIKNWRKKYDWVGFFYEGLARVELDGQRGFIDKKGNEYWDMTEDQAREQKPPFF